jgi:uncharacterized protein (TIGR02679 family)
MTEGVLNRVTARGVIGFTESNPDPVCVFLNKKREPAVWTLENLNRLSHAGSYNKRVYVIENLAVFSAVNERTRNLDRTLICVENGLNPALTLLLDMLCAEGVRLYYSCGMDYPSLKKADSIYLRYPKNFIPWRLSKDDCERAVSGGDFYLTERQKELGLHNEDLAALLSALRKKGKTAVQPSLAEELAADIMAHVRVN